MQSGWGLFAASGLLAGLWTYVSAESGPGRAAALPLVDWPQLDVCVLCFIGLLSSLLSLSILFLSCNFVSSRLDLASNLHSISVYFLQLSCYMFELCLATVSLSSRPARSDWSDRPIDFFMAWKSLWLCPVLVRNMETSWVLGGQLCYLSTSLRNRKPWFNPVAKVMLWLCFILNVI